MSGKVVVGETGHAAAPAESPGSWLSYPDLERPAFSDYGLFLYLTFEDGAGDEWWLMEDGPPPPGEGRVRPNHQQRSAQERL